MVQSSDLDQSVRTLTTSNRRLRALLSQTETDKTQSEE